MENDKLADNSFPEYCLILISKKNIRTGDTIRLSGVREVVVVDLDYFIANAEGIVKMAKILCKHRNQDLAYQAQLRCEQWIKEAGGTV